MRVGNQLRASRASPCGAGVRSLSQCYFNHVPDKLFWTFWPMFARFWKLFSLFSPCLHRDAKRWLSQGQLYLGFFGIFNEEFSENWLERLALTASPAGYSPLQLTFSLFIQFHPPRVYHINQHSFHLFFPLPPRLCQGLKWSVPSQRIRENNAIRELMDDVYKRTTSNESQKWDLE